MPLGAGCADLVISEYGASVWCDPYRWIPEAARLLRPGGLVRPPLLRLIGPPSGNQPDRANIQLAANEYVER